MNKLFIIGNGFDIAHKIESSYEHFKRYLITLLEHVSKESYAEYDFTDSSILTSDYTRSPENDLLTILYFLSNDNASAIKIIFSYLLIPILPTV